MCLGFIDICTFWVMLKWGGLCIPISDLLPAVLNQLVKRKNVNVLESIVLQILNAVPQNASTVLAKKAFWGYSTCRGDHRGVQVSLCVSQSLMFCVFFCVSGVQSSVGRQMLNFLSNQRNYSNFLTLKRMSWNLIKDGCRISSQAFDSSRLVKIARFEKKKKNLWTLHNHHTSFYLSKYEKLMLKFFFSAYKSQKWRKRVQH